MASILPGVNIGAYPKPREAPDKSFPQAPQDNPVLGGWPLLVAGAVTVRFGLLASLLRRNAGFAKLRNVQVLETYEPRYDPSVITVSASPGKAQSSLNDIRCCHSDAAPNGYNTISKYTEAYRKGDVTPLDVARAILNLVQQEDPIQRSTFASVNSNQVIDWAKASTSRYEQGKTLSAMDGVPVAIKDEVDLEEHPRKLGSSVDFSSSRKRTSQCVQNWLDAGAIIIGKLNMHELGLDTTGNNCLSGTPTNAYNAEYYPGGSSSASATAVASNLLPLTLGVDGGGSIRIPSSFNGIYGLKPSHGLISRSPTISGAFSTAVVGPMATCIADLELGLRMLSKSSDQIVSLPISGSVLPKVPLGICRYWFDDADEEVRSICMESVKSLCQKDNSRYEIVDITLPYLREGQLAHALTILSEISTEIGTSRSLDCFSSANKILLGVARQTSAEDFLLAQRLRNLLMQHLSYLFDKHPGLVIVTPTTPLPGWPIRNKSDLYWGISDANRSIRNMTYVWLANFTGCPSISIPISKTVEQGKSGSSPIGLMALAQWGQELALLDWAKDCQMGPQSSASEESKSRISTGMTSYIDVLEIARKRQDESKP